LDNALKYSPLAIAVRIRLESKDGTAYIRVTNPGTPVAPTERERIFERFYRGPGAQKVAAGTGLGLYVARKIAHAHGGSLELEESRPEARETTFCLKLPVLKAGSRHACKAS
jgi:two-component system sensor histidine kinase KdpD